ncbi:hypothetical protein LU293_03435 [Moraxella nasovis]|uniref:hypothetical protein n=1 Tax=Moraxella nasovis TaxID=2904121 RepID=UPI001F60789C|nr:hypothetical protein [Moraxella nasovis]UNU73962.1 hypothetical protein LU293_03435 [Moraxella nasovis]
MPTQWHTAFSSLVSKAGVTLIANIAHKLSAGLTGCLSAKVKDSSCKAGAVGSIIGEMVGDWMTNGHKITLPNGGG